MIGVPVVRRGDADRVDVLAFDQFAEVVVGRARVGFAVLLRRNTRPRVSGTLRGGWCPRRRPPAPASHYFPGIRPTGRGSGCPCRQTPSSTASWVGLGRPNPRREKKRSSHRRGRGALQESSSCGTHGDPFDCVVSMPVNPGWPTALLSAESAAGATMGSQVSERGQPLASQGLQRWCPTPRRPRPTPHLRSSPLLGSSEAVRTLRCCLPGVGVTPQRRGGLRGRAARVT